MPDVLKYFHIWLQKCKPQFKDVPKYAETDNEVKQG